MGYKAYYTMPQVEFGKKIWCLHKIDNGMLGGVANGGKAIKWGDFRSKWKEGVTEGSSCK